MGAHHKKNGLPDLPNPDAPTLLFPARMLRLQPGQTIRPRSVTQETSEARAQQPNHSGSPAHRNPALCSEITLRLINEAGRGPEVAAIGARILDVTCFVKLFLRQKFTDVAANETQPLGFQEAGKSVGRL